MKPRYTYSRRKFVDMGLQAAFAMVLGGHFCSIPDFSTPSKESHLISEIRLMTATSINTMVEFYHGLLGFPVLVENETCCAFQVGASVLRFNYVSDQNDPPFYHFAFNIPENKIGQAEAWQIRKTPIIEPPGHLQDLDTYSKNIVFFRHWNAHSVFFYDPAGNIVEYIARHTMSNANKGNFATNDILYICEIGLVVDDISKTSGLLSKTLDIYPYSTSSDNFLALGDEKGLLLFMKKGRKSVFNRGKDRRVYESEILLHQPPAGFSMTLEKYPYWVH